MDEQHCAYTTRSRKSSGNNPADELLGQRWASAARVASSLGRSRAWVYGVLERHKIRSVSFGEGGSKGARFFDLRHLAEVFDQLATKQNPAVNQ